MDEFTYPANGFTMLPNRSGQRPRHPERRENETRGLPLLIVRNLHVLRQPMVRAAMAQATAIAPSQNSREVRRLRMGMNTRSSAGGRPWWKRTRT